MLKRRISWVMCIVLLVSFTLGTMSIPVAARTTTLSDGAYDTIQKAINEAAPGETIVLPAGNFDILKPISINKPLTLKGTVVDGVLQTVIKGQCAYYINVFSDDVRIEDIKFEGRLGLSANEHAINIGDYINFVIKNCVFLNVSYRGVTVIGNRAKGVITGCHFENIYNGTGVVVYGVSSDSGGTVVNAFWDTYPTMDELKNNLGTDNAVYIEDSYFTKGHHAVASNEGSRYVFRYNTMEDPKETMQSVDTHGFEYQSLRGSRSVEIYNNTLTNSYAHYANIWLRGGDGVVFDNTMTNATHGIFISHTSQIDQPALQDITYPAKDQTKALYAWNNTLDGELVNIEVKVGHEYLLEENRDFFNYALPGYTPYTYPHPLAAEPTPQAPETWASKADYSEGIHSLGIGNSGRQMVKFDFDPAADNINGTVGYAVYGTTVADDVYMALAIHVDTDGLFKVLNDNTFQSDVNVPYASTETYLFKMDVDLNTETYNVWVKPDNGTETLIAQNYAFRSGLNPTDIGTIFLMSDNDDDFSVTDHSIFNYTPYGNVPGAWYSKPSASDGFTDGLHVLDPHYTGMVQVDFDFTPHGNNINGVVGYGGKDTTIAAYSSFSFMLRAYNNGSFDAYNNNAYQSITHIPYTADTTYHIKMIVDLGANTYDAWVTPEGGSEVMLAEDYKFRAATPDIEDIGKLCLVSTNLDDFRVENHTAATIGEASTPPATPTPTATPTPSSESTLITNLVANNYASNWTIRTNLQPGDVQYGDRTFTFDSIPASITGCDWIRNANSSKGYTGELLATFTTVYDADVYIAFNTRISPLPAWMQTGWEDTGENIINQESSTTKNTYRLYKKFYSTGSTVELGPNSTANYGMYNIIVKQRPALISDLVAPAGWVISENLQQGDLQYGDRSFTFNAIPASVAGSDWIRNYNGSKGSATNPLATFTVGEDVHVYVAFSDRATTLPDWFTSEWVDTEESLQNSEPKGYKLYRRFFSAGSTVELGPNGSSNYGMYNIIIKRIAPEIMVNSISDISIRPGELHTVNIGTNLTGTVVQAVYGNPVIADFSLSGYELSITGTQIGSTPVTVTASYPGFTAGTTEFTVTVAADDSDSDNGSEDEGDNNTGTPKPTPKLTPTPSPTPVTPTQQEPTAPRENVITVEQPILDTETGEAKATIASETIAEAFALAEADTQGNKMVSIEIPKVEGAAAYTSVLPAEILTATTLDQKIELKTDVANIIVPSNMLSNTDTTGAKDVSITIANADTSILPADVMEKIGNRPVIDLNVTVDGKKVSYNNPDAPVTVSVPYKPTSEEMNNPENIVVWYINDEGNASPVPNCRYDTETGMITFTTTHFSRYALVFVVKSFDDLTGHAWAKKQIEVMASKGIINGTGEKTFTPGANITRADFTLLLVKSLGLTAKVDSNFTDVDKDSYYYEAVGIAKQLGLAKGTGGSNFNPNEAISRQDMMVLAVRAMRLANKQVAEGMSTDLQAFADSSDVAAYAESDVAAMIKEGLVKGYSGRINPFSSTTRAEAAVLIYRLFNH